jgi:hypothetical protein
MYTDSFSLPQDFSGQIVACVSSAYLHACCLFVTHSPKTLPRDAANVCATLTALHPVHGARK